MKKQTDMTEVKSIAKMLPMTDVHETEFSPIVVQHPFTSYSIVVLPEKDGIDIISVCRYNHNREDVTGMMIESLLKKRNMTKYRLAVDAGIPHATLNDICSGKTKLEKCSAETVYKLAKALGVSMELLTAEGIRQTQRERSYEYGLPAYLQHDLDAYKEGLKNKSPLLDCLWGELYGSINIAEINDGVITKEHADYLRVKYL